MNLKLVYYNNLKLLDICKNYDLIIIDYISSSTFSEVASTNIPILYFNIGRDSVNINSKNLIKWRFIEVKVNIFDNFRGFEKVKKLNFYSAKKNIFKKMFLENRMKNSLYSSLIGIDTEL